MVCFVLGSYVFLSACSEKEETSTQKTVVIDQLAPKYESTLAEGIDFKKPGYPSFLTDVSGVSSREDWGRWTDANIGPVVVFRFNKPLPKKFILELQANAIGQNVGQPIKVHVGNIENNIVVKNWPDETIYQITFDQTHIADSIEINPPSPFSAAESDPKGTDTRMLGLGLIALKIKTID